MAMFEMLFLALVFIKDVNCSPIRETNTAINEDWIDRTLQYMRSNPETLEELINTENTILEGDVVLPLDRNQLGQSWPKVKGNVSVAYLISPDIAMKTDSIETALTWLMNHTCVSFHKRTNEEDYLNFIKGAGCASYLGRIGGKQPVYVGPACADGNICHEILHALGFHHEHTRKDREQHIQVIKNNIMEGMEKNFMAQDGNTFGIPYDQRSIMHYGSNFFSTNGLPTIVAKEPDREMGQRKYMTAQDTQRVRHFYKCDDEEYEATDGGN